jgi:hypothetical protein
MGVFGGQCGGDLGEVKAVAVPVALKSASKKKEKISC